MCPGYEMRLDKWQELDLAENLGWIEVDASLWLKMSGWH
jgi:hypothetical protein